MNKKIWIAIVAVLVVAAAVFFTAGGGDLFKGLAIKGTPHGQQSSSASLVDCAKLKADLDAAKAKFDACKDYYCANSAFNEHKGIYDAAGKNLKTCDLASYGHQQYNEMLNKLGPMEKKMATGKLTLSFVDWPNAMPIKDQTVVIGKSNQGYFGFKLTAENEPIKIESIRISVGGKIKPADFKEIRLFTSLLEGAAWKPDLPVCSSTRCDYLFKLGGGGWIINPGTPLTGFIEADINGEGLANLGDYFKMQINNAAAGIDAMGMYSANVLGAKNKIGNAIGQTTTYIVPFNVVVTGESPSVGSTSEQTVGSLTAIGRFKIKNEGIDGFSSPIVLTHVSFSDSGSNSSTQETYDLWASQENSSNYQVIQLADEKINSVAFGDTTDVAISGGAYRFLTVYIGSKTAGLAAGDSWNLKVNELGKLKYSVTEAMLGYSGNPSTDNDLNDLITDLYVYGTPILGTITKK